MKGTAQGRKSFIGKLCFKVCNTQEEINMELCHFDIDRSNKLNVHENTHVTAKTLSVQGGVVQTDGDRKRYLGCDYSRAYSKGRGSFGGRTQRHHPSALLYF